MKVELPRIQDLGYFIVFISSVNVVWLRKDDTVFVSRPCKPLIFTLTVCHLGLVAPVLALDSKVSTPKFGYASVSLILMKYSVFN